MRKLFLKIIIVFISFLIYFAMFTAFDSNDFSRVRVSCLHNIDDIKVVSYNGDNIFSNSPYPLLKYINDIDKNNEYSIILGDSKFTFLDVMRLSKISGEKYLNISYGGAALEESILEFWYTVKRIKVKKVIFELDFHALNDNWRMDRISKYFDMSYIDMLKAYYFDYYNNRMVIEEVYKRARGIKNEEVSSKEEMMKKGIEEKKKILKIYTINEKAITDLMKITKYCNDNNIELIFFSPPLHKSINELVDGKKELAERLIEIKKELSNNAIVYDMQDKSELSYMESDWLDSSHFTGEIMRQVEDNLAGKSKKYMKIWENGQYDKFE
ncbi:hypothetical protein [Catonella sp.]|uniref:hypothetical protein n=1 Tax=Clostridia TaxID=186801 RepID=UPI003FA17500